VLRRVDPVAGRTVVLPAGVDAARSLEGRRRHGDDLLERFDGRCLLRTLPLDGRPVGVALTLLGARRAVLDVEAGADPDAAAAASRATFVAGPDPAPVDPVLAAQARLHPGVRPVLHPDLFASIVVAISAQQVNLRWAAETRRRLALAFGRRHAVAGAEVWSLDPERLAEATVADLRALQLTTMKSEFVIGAARLVADGTLSRSDLEALDDEGAIAAITSVRGLGRWTADWLLARTLGRPVVAAGVLAVRKAVGLAYRAGSLPVEAEVRQLTAHWGAAANTAQHLLLHAWAAGTLAQ
jgi:DNA-3-methyladenine glycosylase II